MPSNVLPLHLKQTSPPIIWIFTEGEGDGMKSRLPFKTFSTLQIREKHLLDKAYVEYPDFPLVVTGHSLGAGTAVILSFMLRLKYNSVKCFAFGPPGGLLNSQAYAISTTFVTSVVVGDDIICRYVHVAFLAISWRLIQNFAKIASKTILWSSAANHRKSW